MPENIFHDFLTAFSPVKYILDANVFMEASRRYYPFDFAKPFWDGLVSFAKQVIIVSVDKVLDEIKNGNDALKTWAENEFVNYFKDTASNSVITAYAKLVQWAQGESQYMQHAKDVFMQEKNADTWVLAYAMANNLTIVTHETFDSNVTKRIPIPNACLPFF